MISNDKLILLYYISNDIAIDVSVTSFLRFLYPVREEEHLNNGRTKTSHYGTSTPLGRR
jgi:hypothetical protein